MKQPHSVQFATLLFLGLLMGLLSACQPAALESPIIIDAYTPTLQDSSTALLTATQTSTTPTPIKKGTQQTKNITYAYTHLQPDGNRWQVLPTMPFNAFAVDIPLPAQPRWLVAAPDGDDVIWAAVLQDGQVMAFRSTASTIEPMNITPDRLPPHTPPLLRIESGIPSLLTAPGSDASPYTHPVPIGSDGNLAYISSNGDIVIWNQQEIARFSLNALPDARLLVDEQQRLLLYTGATSQYTHGVLGDKIEASNITLIETQPALSIRKTIPFPEGKIAEGIAPIWADMDGDGQREIIVTLSDADQGAQIVVFNELGELIAAGPAIGQGYRWRHQIAAVPLGPNTEMEIVVVRTPHIGGVAEFYSLDADTLQITAQIPGLSSHSIGSRNLDMAAVVDFDADGRPELLAPNQAQTALHQVQRDTETAEIVRTLPVESKISTNLALATTESGHLNLGVGTEDRSLRLWLAR